LATSTNNVGCALAWHGVSVNQDGTLDPCCQYTNPELFQRIPFVEFDQFDKTVRQRMRDDYAAGIQHSGCQKCYQEEQAGWTTLRQYANRWYDQVDQQQLWHVELRLGNYCNLKCIMCSPGSSSSISVERQQHKELFKTVNIYPYTPEMPHYWETIEFQQFSAEFLSQLKRINITGGEPFMIPEVLIVLDRLMPVRDTVNVSFNTNLTILTEKILSRLEQFNNLEVSVSLEGIGEMNDYLRYPSKWEQIQEHIATIQTRIPNAHVSVNHTFQHASVYSLPALSEFCKKNKISLHLTLVQGNEYLGLNSVPKQDLTKLSNWVTTTTTLDHAQKQFIKNIIESAVFNLNLYVQYRDYVSVLDTIRKTDYNQVFSPTYEQFKLFD
jgi:sulfatase maturation enzyme AslB (radical SAM superfamily)